MTSRVLALTTAAALLGAAPVFALEAGAGPRDQVLLPAAPEQPRAPQLGQPRAPDRFDTEPRVDDQALLQYAQALNGLLRVAEIAREQEERALREAGLSEEEFVRLSRRILQDPQVRQRLEEHLARHLDEDVTLAALRTGDRPRR